MLQLKNISYTVEEDGIKKDIIKNVSADISQRFVAITGPNGGGKSTLAKIIAGIYTPTSGRLPHAFLIGGASGSGKSTLAKIIAGIVQPTEGQIFFDGEDITNASVTDRAKMGISYAFQQPVRFKGITVKDLITLAAGKPIKTTEACAYLSEVGLCAREYINREVNASLSGGELKRIEIAMVMARGTKLSVFDEPEAGIDLWSFGNLISVFEKMHTKIQGNILIISHQERILNIADKIIVLAGGSVAEYGAREEVFPKLMDVRSGCYFTTKS